MGKTNKKPNILIIISDQQGIDTIAAYKKYFKHKSYLSHWLKTPNLDKLVNKGYSFLESHSNNPVSSPARSVIFTGRYCIETGVTYNNIGIDVNVPNMGEWFEKHSDYKRVYCGKWHTGGQWNYPDVEGARKIPGFETIPVAVAATGDHNDFQISGALKAFLLNYKEDKPFLAVAGFMNPHDICQWTPGLWGSTLVPDSDIFQLGDKRPPLPPNNTFNFEDPEPRKQQRFTEEEWRNYIYDYCRMVEKLDTDIGRLIDAVDARDDETLVIVTSDHGDGLGRHKRVQKGHPFEEAIKVPMIIYCPGKVKGNIVDRKNIVSGIDIMPTVCEYAKIPTPPNCRGNSLKSLVETGKATNIMSTAFVEFQTTGRVIRHGDFKYAKFYEQSDDLDKPFIRKLDGQSEKYHPGSGRERYQERPHYYLLFDMKNDPWEVNDLSKDPKYAKKMAELENLLVEEWERKVIPGTHHDRN